MTWSVALTGEAEGDIDKLDPLVASGFLAALDELEAEPLGHERLVPAHYPWQPSGWLFKPRVSADGEWWSVVAGVGTDAVAEILTVEWVRAYPIPDYSDL